MITGIEHIGVMAKDPVALAEWYVQVLQFREIFRVENIPAVFVAGEKEGMIEFIPYPEGQALLDKDQRVHLAIGVDDFESAQQRLQEAGVEFPEPPRDIANGGKIQFFPDPEGNWLHLVYRPKAPWDDI
jgi:catechol 2,3-dioxygenase-like lactoylglutathione lyase family enzyme